MRLEKALSDEPFGIHYTPNKHISVYDGQEVFTMSFDSPEEYWLYIEDGNFYSKVLLMLEEYFSQNPPF
jgi:hypothetical protein